LGDPDDLPSAEDVKKKLAQKISDKLQGFIDEAFAAHEKTEAALNKKRQAMAAAHRQAREKLKLSQVQRHIKETKTRAGRLPSGLKALWFRLTGKYATIKKKNEAEAKRCKLRDQEDMQNLIDRQQTLRRKLQHEMRLHRHQHGIKVKKLGRDVSRYLKMKKDEQGHEIERERTDRTGPQRRRRRDV